MRGPYKKGKHRMLHLPTTRSTVPFSWLAEGEQKANVVNSAWEN
jgi:hypothetical protein